MADETKGFAPYPPDKLPPPSNQTPLEKGLSASLVPGSDEILAIVQRGEIDNLLTELHDKVNEPGGYTPQNEVAALYAQHVMETVYPVTPYSPDKPLERIYAEVSTKCMQRINSEIKEGKISPETGSVEVKLEMERMTLSFEKYLQTVLYMDCMARTGNKEFAKSVGSPERLLGHYSEIDFLQRAMDGRFEKTTDEVLMKLLSHYRSFRLAEEIAKAAHEKRPVDKNIVQSIWEANNVRRATVENLRKQEIKKPDVESPQTQ